MGREGKQKEEKKELFPIQKNTLEKLDNDLHRWRKEFENYFNKGTSERDVKGNKCATQITKNLSWFAHLFDSIKNYFFGNAKHYYPVDPKEFKTKIEDTKALIGDMNEMYGDNSFDEALEIFNDPKGIFSGAEKLLEAESVIDTEKEKERVGALGGEELAEELDHICGYISQIFEKGYLTASYSLPSIQMRMMKAIGYDSTGKKTLTPEIDFNNPDAVEKMLVEFSESLISYQGKYPVAPKEKVDPKFMVEHKKDVFRDAFVESILTPLTNKVKAIRLNKELVAQGKEPLKFEPADYMTEEVAEAWQDYVAEREEAKALADLERQPAVKELQKQMTNIMEGLSKTEVNNATLLNSVKAFMYLNKTYEDRRAYNNNDLMSQFTLENIAKGMENFKHDAEKFLKNVSLDEIQKMASDEKNAIGFFRDKIADVKEMPDEPVKGKESGGLVK